MRITSFIILFLVVSISCIASNVDKEIDNLFTNWNNADFPGCAVAVVQDQKVIYMKGFGCANLESKTPISSKSIFGAASISKQFTTFAVALLIKQGKVNINDKIKKYFPLLPDVTSNITIRDIIYHTDGLRDQWDLLTFGGWNLYTDSVSQADILNLIQMQNNLNFASGTEYRYGNTGYTLLAMLVEKVTGKTFPEYCKENIFLPLKMTHTFFNDDYNNVIDNLAESYQSDNNKIVKCSYNMSSYGATGLYSNLEDMVKWSNNFYSHSLGGIDIYKMITSPGRLSSGKTLTYGFGLELKNYKGHKYIGHAGAVAGYNNFILIFPDDKLSIIIFSNLFSIHANDIAFKIADLLLQNINNKLTGNEDKFELSKNILDSYNNFTGIYYSKSTGTDIIISKKQNSLVVELMGLSFTLKNVGFNEFVVEDFPDIKLAFSDNGYELSYDNNMDDIVISDLTKVTGRDLQTNNLDIYKGNYFCPELNVTYKVELSDNKLVMIRPRFVKSVLSPCFKDFFNATNGFWGIPYNVVFRRDNKGEIIGFNISTAIITNRLIKLTFNKVQ